VSAHTQQEDLENLKAWWNSYGGSVIAGVVLGAALLGGYRYWDAHQEGQRVAASGLYDQLRQQIAVDGPEAKTIGTELVEKYSQTPYAAMAALSLARQAHDANDKALARQHIEWAVANAKDDATLLVARLRLTRLLLDIGDLPAASAALGGAGSDDIAGFESEYNELKGDLAFAQGQTHDARQAYKQALDSIPDTSPYSSVLQMKLDELGPESQT
jgi:predicted negative regulator of RcsB-dependent stress response